VVTRPVLLDKRVDKCVVNEESLLVPNRSAREIIVLYLAGPVSFSGNVNCVIRNRWTLTKRVS
jgi:hypothetical protein